MAKISPQRQVTVPKEQCQAAAINIGDEVDVYAERIGVISIVKKEAGAAKGLLKNASQNAQVSDQESFESSIIP